MPVFIIFLTLFFILSDRVDADNCSLLASQFSMDKSSLDVDELSSLEKCITDQMRLKFSEGTVPDKLKTGPKPFRSLPSMKIAPLKKFDLNEKVFEKSTRDLKGPVSAPSR